MPPTPASMFLTKRSWPGHVDDLDREPVGLLQEREAEVDRDAARLLLRQPVGVGAGERLDQRGLAVVDVPGGADDDVRRRRALMTRCGERRARLGRVARRPVGAAATVAAVEEQAVVDEAAQDRRVGRARSASSSARGGGARRSPTASAAVGSSTVGSAPPPTCECASTTLRAEALAAPPAREPRSSAGARAADARRAAR